MTIVVLDPIYSARPSRCSSAQKCKKIVERVLFQEGRTDVFFRWLVPHWLFEEKDQNLEDMHWFPNHPNVHYEPFWYHKDRMFGYQVFTREYDELLAFNGKWWDVDVLITMRTQQVPHAKIVMNSPRMKKQAWLKRVILYEELPVMSFKKTAAVSNVAVQNLATLAGYQAADDVFITISHERDGIIRTARDMLAPSEVRKLQQKIQVTSPSVIDQFTLKDPTHRYDGKRPFCLGFVDRMSNTLSRLETVYSVMEHHWIGKGPEQFRVVISTVSTGIKMKPPKFVKLQNSPREEFWRLLKQEMDVVLFMAVEGGFGMSLMEPLMFGTPVILAREEWTEALVGPDYPFFVKGEAEAYAMVKLFIEDYEGLYAKFAEWQQTKFRARFAPGGVYERNFYTEVYDRIMRQRLAVDEYAEKYPGKKLNRIVRAIENHVRYKSEMVVLDVIRDLGYDRELYQLADKTAPDDRYHRSLVFSTAWNELRIALKAFYGWEDASPRVGHLRRVS